METLFWELTISALVLRFAMLRCQALIVAYKKPTGALSALPADHVPIILVDQTGEF